MRTEQLDVVIIGAGLSGIGTACHLERRLPGTRYAILEARDALGGTWDLYRYPGIRSDSDMYTLGYAFKPWADARSIADGSAILEYIRAAAKEYGVDRHIRYDSSVTSADWSESTATWMLEVHSSTGEVRHIETRFLMVCAGYYRYDRGHIPDFRGQEDFAGTVVHPQHWPEDLDWRDRRVVIVGSGATAVTLVPELAKSAARVVMLQRSPTYMFSQPDTDAIANVLKCLLPKQLAYNLTRWKNIRLQRFLYRISKRRPRLLRRFLVGRVRKALGGAVDVDRHFTPDYDPWDQRLCLVPNDDLFDAVRDGKASIVTDRIDRFTRNGIRLASGRELEADIIVTATGFEIQPMGGIEFSLDGVPVDLSGSYTYRGMMLSGVPNAISIFGYINASWTLRADLVAGFACRLLRHMQQHGYTTCRPTLRADELDMPRRPWVTGFSAGYLARVMDDLPKQGDREPWCNTQDYLEDRKRFLKGPIDDGVLAFSRAGEAATSRPGPEFTGPAAGQASGA